MLNGSFVLRAGFSLSPVQNNMSSDGLMGYPDEVNVSYSGANSYSAFGNISNGIPAIVPPALTNGATLVPAGTGNLFTDPPNFIRGYAESYQSVTLQKEFDGGWTLQTGYVGTHVVHQYTEYNSNYGQLGQDSQRTSLSIWHHGHRYALRPVWVQIYIIPGRPP